MGRKWIVNVSNAKEIAAVSLIYGSGYLPRGFHYKKDAEKLLTRLKDYKIQSAYLENVEQNKR